MSRTLMLAVVGSLLMVDAAGANTPLPMNLKLVSPLVRFEGVDKHKDHVFYLRYTTLATAAKYVEVKDAKDFKLDGPDIFDFALLAIERKEFEKRAKVDPNHDWLAKADFKWLADKAEGVIVAKITRPNTIIPAVVKEVPVTTYRVEFKGGKLTAEKVEDKKGGEPLQAGLLPTWAFGIVSSLSIAWFGIWFARRSRQ